MAYCQEAAPSTELEEKKQAHLDGILIRQQHKTESKYVLPSIYSLS